MVYYSTMFSTAIKDSIVLLGTWVGFLSLYLELGGWL